MDAAPFWKLKTLAEMTAEEWESLCDRCGKCCVLKIEDMDDGTVHYTDIARCDVSGTMTGNAGGQAASKRQNQR